MHDHLQSRDLHLLRGRVRRARSLAKLSTGIAIAGAAALLSVASACGGRRARVVQPRIGHSERGIASWYGDPYHGRRSANGEIYDMEKLTAAHRTFAFDTWVRVHNLDNGKSVDVRITDRGPFVNGRIIDLSRAAAREIDMVRAGLAKVRIEVIPAPEVEPRPAEVRSPPVPGLVEHFAVQTGAFRDRENAEQNRAEIEAGFGTARLVLHEGAPPLWRVIAGRFARMEDALALADRIRKSGRDAFVVRVDGEDP
jgi:rare lipoprotein A